MKYLSLLFITLLTGFSLSAEAKTDSLLTGYPVIYSNDTLFNLYTRLGPFTPEERATAIVKKVDHIFNQHDFNPDSIYITENEYTSDVMYGDIIIASATYSDGVALGKTRIQVARMYYTAIVNAGITMQHQTTWQAYLLEAFLAILALMAIAALIWVNNKAFTAIRYKLISSRHQIIKGLSFNGYEFLTASRELALLLRLLKVVRWSATGLICYLSLPILFSIFPWTESYSNQLLDFILIPIRNIIGSIITYIPNLLTIGIILLITKYVVRFFKFISEEIDRGALTLPGFYSDWAKPTFNILRFLVYAFTFIVIFPYLPGSNSPVFQGVSVFLGILFSLGSSSAISNIVAGVVITYMRPFKIGQRVKIGDVTGDVVEKTLLVTKIRTAKNEDITLPNSNVLSAHTINYSTMAQESGLILHTTITIGYDVPWRKVHEVLKSAALQTEGTLKTHEPFVLQTSLDDFYVSYQINCYTDQPNRMASIYSELYQNIQDKCNEAGIEIMSPHYQALRDGNMTTIPENYLAKHYKAPAFTVTDPSQQQERNNVNI